MEPLLATGFAVFALLIGLALGWVLWGRHGGRDEAEFKTAIKELADARVELATLKANEANFDKQIALLNQAREELLVQFKATGGEVLSRAQDEFLKRAEEKFGGAEKANKEAVSALLEPVNQRLKRYEDQVEALEKQRVDAFGQLTGLIQSMREGQEAVRTAAHQLGSALRNNSKARGRWGEQQLRNVLEQCGLSEHTDFIVEQSVETEGGRLRPDAIVRIPGKKLLVIDAKVSLNDYQDAVDAVDDAVRDACLDRHVISMRNHIQTLGAKSYQSQFEEAPDYVVMFVPGEHFIAAAIERDARKRESQLHSGTQLNVPDLWNFAFDRRVLLASPTNLVAICRTIAQVWRQDGLAREAREIGRMGAELYDRLAVSAEHLKRVGGGLESAVSNYNKFVGSYERNVLSSGKRLAEKGIEIGKRAIDEVPLVESAPRYGVDDAAGERLLGDAANATQEAAE